MAEVRSCVSALAGFSRRPLHIRTLSCGPLHARPFSAHARQHATAAAVQEQIHDTTETSPSTSDVGERMRNIQSAKPFSSFLTDTFNRQHDYLRISITERCNLRCLYCMPEEGVPLSPKKHLLTHHEILYLASLFVSQGVTKIRLTGGEPTVHPEIMPMLQNLGKLRDQGLRELALTTNGLTLSRKLDTMIEAGVTGINLSLDTLDPLQFELMTRRRGFDQVMKSISGILERNRLGAQVKLKVNAVVIRGLNDAQLIPFVEMTRDKDMEVRFIEYMPFDGNRWSSQKMLPYQEMLEVIREKYPGVHKVQDHPNDTSKTYRIPGFAGRLGFITSMTDHFCGTCNRLRITSDGNLKVCLFGNAEVSLRDMLRRNFNKGEPIDEAAWEAMKQVEMDRNEGRSQGDLGMRQKEMELLDIIGVAVKRKKEKHAGIGELENMKNRPMILIGQSPFSPHRVRVPSVDVPARLNFSSDYGLPAPGALFGTRLMDAQKNMNSLGQRTFSTASRRFEEGSWPSRLTHLNPSGSAHMVNIPPPPPARSSPVENDKDPQHKAATHRKAIARSIVRFSNAEPLRLIREASLKKGDVSAVARIAGIMAAKRTSELVPLCHNIPLSGVSVEVDTVDAGNLERISASSVIEGSPAEWQAKENTGDFGAVAVTATVQTFGQTGVEMEALTAASVAALTVYDMCKGVDRGMVVDSTRVVLKEGGRSGTWQET